MDIIIYPAISFLILGLVFIIAVLVAVRAQRARQPSKYRSSLHQKYVPGEFSGQMEFDLRLPYRRFKQLYPHSNVTYREYKQLQMRSAFRRSMSSQDNKRMVR